MNMPTAKTLKGATVAFTGSSATTISAGLYSVTPPSDTFERIDVTSLSTSGKYKEFIGPDFIEGGSLSFEMDYNPSLGTDITGCAAFMGTALNKTLTFPASIQSISPANVAPNGVAKMTVSVFVNGAVVVT